MPRNVLVPPLGLGETPLMLAVWHVRVGQRIVAGDRMAEVVGDGALAIVPSPVTGIVSRLHAEPGGRVEEAALLAEIKAERIDP